MINFDEEERLFLRLFESDKSFSPSSYKKEDALQSMIKENKGILINAKEINIQTISKLKQTIKDLGEFGFNLDGKMVAVQMSSEQYLTGEELEFLIEIEQFLQENNANLVMKAEDLFTLNEILVTNDKLQSEVDYINSLTVANENNRPLNKLEKFIMAYDFCTNFKYNEHENDTSKSRYITSILNGNNIVCVGYAKLLKEMCSRLGIECYSVGVTCIDTKTQKKEGHQNNIVVLDGKLYYADACWDSQRDEIKGLKLYNHCLTPMSDREYISGCEVKYSDYNVLPYTKEYLIKAIEFSTSLKKDLQKIDECERFLSMFDNIVGNIQIDGTNVSCEGSFQDMMNEMKRVRFIKQLEVLIDFLKTHQDGKAIDLDCFKTALYNIYLAKGMNEKTANNLLDRTIKANMKRAQKCFNSNAENCFITGKIQNLEI